jgi:hypothetical protein
LRVEETKGNSPKRRGKTRRFREADERASEVNLPDVAGRSLRSVAVRRNSLVEQRKPNARLHQQHRQPDNDGKRRLTTSDSACFRPLNP